MTSADVTPIRPGHEFDVDRLAHYLASHLEGVSGTLTARQFRGGQSNPTFLVETGHAARRTGLESGAAELIPIDRRPE